MRRSPEGGGSAGGDRGVRTVRMDEQQVSRSAGEEGAGRLMFCLCLTVYNAHLIFTFSSLRYRACFHAAALRSPKSLVWGHRLSSPITSVAVGAIPHSSSPAAHPPAGFCRASARRPAARPVGVSGEGVRERAERLARAVGVCAERVELHGTFRALFLCRIEL